MSLNEDEVMKSFYKDIDFEKMDRNAKIKAKLSLVLTLPLSLIGLCSLFINWTQNDIFSNDVYGVIFWIPTWIALFCSILGYIFKNGLALERISLVPKIEIYILVTFPLYIILKQDVFQMSDHQQNLIFTIISLIVATISLVAVIVCLVQAIYYEKKAISSKDKFIQS